MWKIPNCKLNIFKDVYNIAEKRVSVQNHAETNSLHAPLGDPPYVPPGETRGGTARPL